MEASLLSLPPLLRSSFLCFRSLLNPVNHSQLACAGSRVRNGRSNLSVSSLDRDSLPANGGANHKEDGKPKIFAAPAVMVDAFTRRFTLGASASLLVALGGNLAGVTSFLLGFNPDLARSLRLDFLYPVNNFLRYFDTDKGFEFIYPASWVSDQRLLLRAVEKAENARSLDLPAAQNSPQVSRLFTDPAVAFGPPGSNGELNVSVIVAPTTSGFSIGTLGNAQEVGSFILRSFIAPEGSDKVAIEFEAQERHELLGKEKVSYYLLEYSVKAPTFYRHNVAVYSAYRGQLFSLNAQTPQALWEKNKENLLRIANSFRLLA